MCIIPLKKIHKEAQWGSLVPFRETWRGLEFPKLFLRSEFSFCWSLGVLLPDAPPPGLTSPSAHPTSWFPLGLEAGRITMTSPPPPKCLMQQDLESGVSCQNEAVGLAHAKRLSPSEATRRRALQTVLSSFVISSAGKAESLFRNAKMCSPTVQSLAFYLLYLCYQRPRQVK